MAEAPLSLDDAGILLADALAALEALEDREIPDCRDGDPLPRGVITCGQACRLAASVVAMVCHTALTFGR